MDSTEKESSAKAGDGLFVKGSVRVRIGEREREREHFPTNGLVEEKMN